MRALFAMKPSRDHKDFSDLVSFIAHVSVVYGEATRVSERVVELLAEALAILDERLGRI